ncbi:MAG TPA: ATP-binding protein [Acidimicrobiales bacterium]|nr:ATP-binding protein [Acidimicrobiales bacterium]
MSHRVSQQFDPDPRQVGDARRFARAAVEGWGLKADDLELVVGELAANAVLHARSPYALSLHHDDGLLLVEVSDSNVRYPLVADAPARSLSGRGLGIVARLARSWGVRPDGDGKVVWVELPAVEVGVPA